MSQRDLEAVIGRAIVDKAFRELLFADPDAALQVYELSEGELAALRKVDAETLDACGGSLGKQVLKALTRNHFAPRE
jgi:hypothetical protein